MAQKNTSGTKPIPRLVVKIVGGKQVKQFIEESREDTEEEGGSHGPGRQDEAVSRSQQRLQDRVDSALWTAISQVPDRLCVTAPPGDRSRSYIHPRTRHVPQVLKSEPQTTDQSGESEDRDEAKLSSAVMTELCDWPLSSLTSTEEEAAALDPSSSGMLSRPEITHLFLKNHVPLTLPTFSLLLHVFSDENDPIQINYRNLLHFIKTTVFPEDLPGDE